MEPLISIVVPVFNVEAYLEECIQSIEQQTFSNFQCILVNDGSTDNSRKICEEISKKDKRFECISQTNQGISAARNHGIRKAKGYYILFVDSDDILIENALEVMVSLLKRYNNPDLVCCKFESFGLYNYNYRFYPELCYFSSNKEIKKTYYFSEFYEMVWNKLVKRNLIIQHGFWFEEDIRFHEDTLWSFLLVQKLQSMVLCPEITYKYRLRDASITNNKNSHISSFDSYLKILKKMMKNHKDKPCKATNNYLCNLIIDFILSIFRDKEINEIRKKEFICEYLKLLKQLSFIDFIKSNYEKGEKLLSLMYLLPKRTGYYFLKLYHHLFYK